MRKTIFKMIHQIGDSNFLSIYDLLSKNQWKPYEEMKESQEKQLREMINFAYENVPYYHGLLKELKLAPSDFSVIEDLEKLPILTKEIVKNNWEDFKPKNLREMNYREMGTGGSTGTPFRYRQTRFDRLFARAILYRAWGYGGYKLADRVVFMGGSSLNIGVQPFIFNKVREFVLNVRMLSSFDMTEKNMGNFIDAINLKRPKFIYGYPSSMYFFSDWIEKNGKNIHNPNGIFSTAERLFPHMREKIEKVFNCKIFDLYGLNDGSISAAECNAHNGLHIDTERGVLEVVDEAGLQLNNGKGTIIATSLYNFALPLLRYHTGDIGYIINESCSCGRGYRLLKEIVGREQEMLQTPEGKFIHGEFFTHIFWEIEGVKEFQVIQEKLDELIIKILPDSSFNPKQIDKIRRYIEKRSKGWHIDFQMVDNIDRSRSGKYRFIVNEMKS